MIEVSDRRRFERDRRFARADITAVQGSSAKVNEKEIDSLLGIIGDFKRDEEFIGPDAAARYRKEKWGYQGTSYETIRSVIRATHPSKGQIFYDLGSGQGRIVLYGALASEARFIGIELLKERVDACNAAKARLGIENAEFRVGNVTDFDISDGDIFYLFNPFSSNTIKEVTKVLRQIANKRKTKIVCTGGIQLIFAQEPWLHLDRRIYSPEVIDIFESKDSIKGS